MNLYRYVALIICLLWIAPATAEMYQWVDADGVTHFSQTTPPDSTNAVRTPIPQAPALGDGALVREQEQKARQMQEQDAIIRKEQEETREKATEIEAVNEKNCAAAKHNYEILQASTRRRYRTPDGEYHRLTEEQRQQRISEAEQMIKRSCGE
jgi:hypothetical protein